MAPIERPIPRFIADNSQEGIPHGRFAEQLGEAFRAACGAIDELPAEAGEPEEIDWFPERTWGGRVWVPASARVAAGSGNIELFGSISYVQPEEGDPVELQATADYTDVIAEDQPGWRIDLSDEVIGRWRADRGIAGDVTMVWGRPLIQGAVAATAELDGETVDQEEIAQGRFTLIALDNVTGLGDEIYMTVKLWSRRIQELASESLYEEGGGNGAAATPGGSAG